jgi:hypothetical protein
MQSSIGLTQDSVSAWINVDGNVCMTPTKAAQLLNDSDSLDVLYGENKLIEQALLDCQILASLKDEVLDDMLERKKELESKIEVLEERLQVRDTKVKLSAKEIDECNLILDKNNKKLKKARTATAIVSVVGGVSFLGALVLVLSVLI